jgi:hypothetical protein
MHGISGLARRSTAVTSNLADDSNAVIITAARQTASHYLYNYNSGALEPSLHRMT